MSFRKNVKRTKRATLSRRSLLCESLEDRRLMAFDAELIKDINAKFSTGGSQPLDFADVNGTLFFTATTPTSGRELWKSDGTAAGTALVKDLGNDDYGNQPRQLTNVNGTLFFTGFDAAHGRELWKSDGTAAGTVMVADINPGPDSAFQNFIIFDSGIRPGFFGSEPLVNIGGTVYFSANDGSRGYELWKSDGTEAGTVLVKDTLVGEDGGFPRQLINANGTLYFSAENITAGRELWKSDGTTAGTKLVRDIEAGPTSSYPTNFANVGGTVFFTATTALNGSELWKSDGTSAGTTLVKDLTPGNGGSYLNYFTAVNGNLYFQQIDSAYNRQLYKTDGTPAGTQLVKSFTSASGFDFLNNLTEKSGTLFFTVHDGTTGTQLWKSDGTTGGTSLVRSLGTDSAFALDLQNINGLLYFQDYNGSTRRSLWKSDGTTAGTNVLRQYNSPTNSYAPTMANLTGVGGKLFYSIFTETRGDELWQSDGTVAGTALVKDIVAGTASSYPGSFIDVNGTLYFSANDGNTGTELWKSDGTSAGTTLVADISPGADPSYPRELRNLNGKLVFTAYVGASYTSGLFTSDGTAAGTVNLSDLVSDLGTSTNLRGFTTVGNNLYFFATDGNQYTNLWKTDGTAAGTIKLEQVSSNNYGWYGSYQAYNNNGTLYFSANNGTDGVELWKTNGTPGGATMVANINASGDSTPGNFLNIGGTLYFTAYTNATGGRELWKTNGTAAGTMLVKDLTTNRYGSYPSGLTNVNGTLYFTAYSTTPSGGYARSLYKTDGTAAGTSVVVDFSGGYFYSDASFPTLGNTLFFVQQDPLRGNELWKTDGTAAGTTLVKDINAGPGNANPMEFTVLNGQLFFAATSDTSGRELWMTDGTTNGTKLVKDIVPGLASSNPASLMVAGGELYFSAVTPNQGNELWHVRSYNATPVLGTNTGFTVPESQRITITSAMLAATDLDHDASQLTYTVGTPTRGHLEFSDQLGATILSFTQADLDLGRVVYVHDGGVYAPQDKFTVRVADPLGATSPTATVTVTVQSVNDVPKLTLNTGLRLNQGATSPINATKLVAADSDNLPNQLTYNVTSSPQFGRLAFIWAQGVAITSFKQSDVNAGSVVYIHNGTDNADDGFTFNLTDTLGAGPTNVRFDITAALASNVSTPVLKTNGASDSVILLTRSEAEPLAVTLSADDPDPNEKLRYDIVSLAGTDFNDFTVDPITGVLSFALGAGDFETPTDGEPTEPADNQYEVYVRVTDGAGHTDTQVLGIVVVDANELPRFVTPTTITRSEGYTTPIFITAFDDDNDTTNDGIDNNDPVLKQTLAYNLVPRSTDNPSAGIDGKWFTIDQLTGELKFVGLAGDYDNPVDANRDSIYQVTVQVTDGQTPRSQTFAIRINPANDNVPKFTSSNKFSVDENVPLVTQLTATDADRTSTGGSQKITYSISPNFSPANFDANRFAVDPNTGELTFLRTGGENFDQPHDYDYDNIYQVVVRADDGLGGTSDLALTITLNPVNDNVPRLYDWTLGSGQLTVDEGTTYSIATVQAFDNDRVRATPPATGIVDANKLTYSLSGVDSKLFKIDATTGDLAFVDAPNFEKPLDANKDNNYVFTVSVSDGDFSSGRVVTVTVNNINDAPVITSNGGGDTATVTAAENQTFVTNVIARDDDQVFLKFAISGGDDASLFSIGKNTGTLVFRSAPDFETFADKNRDGVYEVEVQAIDDQGATDTQLIKVTVTDAGVAAMQLKEFDVTVGGVAKKQLVLEDIVSKNNWLRVYRDGSYIAFALPTAADSTSYNPDDQFSILGTITGASLSNDKRTLRVLESSILTRGTKFSVQTKLGDDTVVLGKNAAGNNDFIPTGNLLEVLLGGGTNTLDIDDHTSNKTENKWSLTGDDSGSVQVGLLGTFTFDGANYIRGGQGIDHFNLLYTGETKFLGINGDTGSQLDDITITRDANFTLSNTSLAVDTVALDQIWYLNNIGRAFITGGAGNNAFDLTAWTKSGDGTATNSFGGKIVGGGGNDKIVKTSAFTSIALSDTKIQASDGMALALAAIANAELTTTVSANFDLSGWKKDAVLTPSSDPASTNQLTYNNGTFAKVEIGDNYLRFDGKNRIQFRDFNYIGVIGNASNQEFVVSSTTFTTSQAYFDGGGGHDKFEFRETSNASRSAYFGSPNTTASGYFEVVSSSNISLLHAKYSNFDSLAYVGGSGNDKAYFDAEGAKSFSAVGNGGIDLVEFVSIYDSKISLDSTSATFGEGSAARRATLTGINSVNLNGSTADQQFTVTTWPGVATINAGGGNDTLVVQRDANFTLDDSKVTVAGKDISYASVENLSIIGGTSNNKLTLLPGYDAKLSGTFGIDLKEGLDTLNLGGTSGFAGNVTVNQLAAPTPLVPSTIIVGTRTLKFASNSALPESLEILGTSVDQAYSAQNYTGTLTLNGAGGNDSLAIATNAPTLDLALTNTTSTFKVGGQTNRLTNVERFTIVGGDANQTLALSGYSTVLNDLTFNGGNGSDVLKFTTSAASTALGDGLLSSYAGQLTVKLSSIERAELTGDATNQTFDLATSSWTGTAAINGGAGTDTLLAQSAGNMKLTGAALTLSSPTTRTFNLSGIEVANLTGDNGKNVIDASGFSGQVKINGLDGDDILLGANNTTAAIASVIDGGAGNDWLSGGIGNDSLSGGLGNDILVGGRGADTLALEEGQNIYIGGSTSYDTNLAAIEAIMTYWNTSSLPYGTFTSDGLPLTGRLKGLFIDGVGSGSTKYFLRTSRGGSNTPTVVDDGSVDIFQNTAGNTGLDWYFANFTGSGSLDTLPPLQTGELGSDL